MNLKWFALVLASTAFTAHASPPIICKGQNPKETLTFDGNSDFDVDLQGRPSLELSVSDRTTQTGTKGAVLTEYPLDDRFTAFVTWQTADETAPLKAWIMRGPYLHAHFSSCEVTE